MSKILLKNGIVVTGKKKFSADILIEGEKIKLVAKNIKFNDSKVQVIDCKGKYIFPGFLIPGDHDADVL